MTEERLLKIKDVSSDGENTDTVEMETTCLFYGDEKNCTIEFDEIFAEDMKSHTVLRVKDGKCAHLLRRGSINTELIIEKGARHNCAYCTPYGELMVGITGSDFICEKRGTFIRLKMNYTVDFYGEINQTKEMTVVVGKPVIRKDEINE